MKLPIMNVVLKSDSTEHARSVSSIALSCRLVKDSVVATVADMMAHRCVTCHTK
jgi:hypothetical protein